MLRKHALEQDVDVSPDLIGHFALGHQNGGHHPTE